MKVELVNHTPNPESFIAYIARVSNPENQDNPDYEKLIKYLIKNGHWSPFEHSYFTFKIETSRAIAAQILRHRSFTFQEYSQRYSPVDVFEPIELRKQAKKNRQSSDEVINPGMNPDNVHGMELSADVVINMHLQYTKDLYKRLLSKGVAKETARFILPLTTQTTLYMTGSGRSFVHYLALRNDSHTQKEHQLIAQEIEKHLRVQLPLTFTALDSIREQQQIDSLILQMIRQKGYSDREFLELLLSVPSLTKT